MPIKATDDQIKQIVAIATANCADAWDMGFQGSLNPGDKESAAKILIERFGFEQTKMIVKTLDKRR